MLGRAAYHEPYRLHELEARMFGGEPASREALLRRFLPYVETQLARGVALKHLTRHVLGLFHAQPGGRAFRQVLSEGAPRPGAGIEVVERALAATRDRALAA
jgi:tRNA-dihydrouridine synthase A